jgi:GTP-binding protein HflX
VAISALTGEGVDELMKAVDEALPFDPIVRVRFRFPAGDGAGLAMLYAAGRVLDIRYDELSCEVEADVPESLKRRLEKWTIS